MPRTKLPEIRQMHVKDCPNRDRPKAVIDCACRWGTRFRLPGGQPQRIREDTREDVVQEYHKLMSSVPAPLADKATTVAQWSERWLAAARSPDGKPWRPSTAQIYRSWCRAHISPDPIARMRMTEIRRDDVRLWLGRRQDAGACPSARRNALTLLHAMYQTWIKDGRLLPYGNPAVLMLSPRPARKDWLPLTREQVTAWAAHMPAEMRLIVTMEAFYGPRCSEILAIREEDVEFKGKNLSTAVGPQLARLAELPGDDYRDRNLRLHFQRKIELDRTAGPMKNRRGDRKLPLPQWLCADLADQLNTWPAVNGWLFTNRNARHTRPQAAGGPTAAARIGAGLPMPYLITTYTDRLRHAASAAGITLPPRQCSHALRHHCVSVLRDMGKSDQQIAFWIGDAELTVATVYGRPMPDAMDRIADDLSDHREQPRLRAV